MIDSLIQLGFSRKEAKVYIALLRLGTSKASDLCDQAGIRRETTYSILKSLEEKGLASSVTKEGVNHYTATDPSFIEEKIRKQQRTAEEILPDLQELQSEHVAKPSFKLYEGREGVKSMLKRILEADPDMVRVISSNKNVQDVLKPYLPDFYLQQRIAQNIRVKLLTDSELLTDELVSHKFLPENIELSTLNHIYNDTVSMISLSQDEPIGTVIEDQNIAATQRKLFELLFQLL